MSESAIDEQESAEEESEGLDHEPGEETPRGRRKSNQPRGFDAVALRELRRARKLVKDGEPTGEATFAVATANVLALLDLASAIRDANGARTTAAE